MDQTFNVEAFISRIGKRLVGQFDDARAATSPATVGAAMEQPVRAQMEQILPRGIKVGSGFVIDSQGGTSRQTDLVLYERDICPVFSINNTPETTYYPCEGVIAVGEVKSTLDSQSLEDAFKKIESVKKLKRHQVYHPVPVSTGQRPLFTRGYGTIQGDSMLTATEGDETPETAQIFGFVVAGDLRIKPETLCASFRKLARETGDQLCPNMVVILNGGLVNWGNLTKGKVREPKWSEDKKPYVLSETTKDNLTVEPTWSAQKANSLRYIQEEEPFRILIHWLSGIYHEGKTSDARAFEEYITRKESPNIPGPLVFPKGDSTIEVLLQNLGPLRKQVPQCDSPATGSSEP